MLAITVRCIFEEDGKFYPQIFLDDALYQCTYVSKRH